MSKSLFVGIEKIIELQKKIEASKTDTARLEGQLESLMLSLKENFSDCSSLKEAEKRIFEEQKKIKNKEEEREGKINKVLNKYQDILEESCGDK